MSCYISFIGGNLVTKTVFVSKKVEKSFLSVFWILGIKNVKVIHVMWHIIYWVNLVTKTVFWNKKVEKVVFELLEPFLALFVILE